MKNQKLSLRSYIVLFQIASIISTLDFSRGLFLVHFSSLGISSSQLGILQTILFWTSFIFEIPTGFFADRFGRKISLLAGLFLLSMNYYFLSYLQSFSSLAICFFIWGVAYSFISGSANALFYDGLASYKKIELHIKCLSINRSLGTILMAIVIIAGGWLYRWHHKAIFVSTSFFVLLSFGLFLLIPEFKKENRECTEDSIVRKFTLFFKSKKGKKLFVFILGMGLIEMVQTPIFIFSSLIFKENNFNEQQISYITSLAMLITAALQFISFGFRSRPLRQLLIIIIGCMMTGILGIYFTKISFVKILFFIIVNTLPMFLFIHTDQYIQDHCESDIRASLLSIQSFVNAGMIGMSYIILGYLGDIYSISTATLFLLIPLMLSIVIFIFYFKKENVGVIIENIEV